LHYTVLCVNIISRNQTNINFGNKIEEEGKTMSMHIQMKKGVLELCVLATLFKKDCYGYELVKQISENIEIAEGTIYPLLKRLKDEGYFVTYLEESQEGPPRKYYRLTDLGVKTKVELESEWCSFVDGVNTILEGGEEL
jgi:PadR family transcriptional regulator PadR